MKILVGYNGLDVGKDLLDLAVHRIKAYSGEVYVVTSFFDDADAESIAEAKKNLEEAKAYLDAQGVKYQTHLLVRNRYVGEDIVDFANENEIDEIVIGVKSRSKVGKLLFSATAQYVILKSPCPVTSIR
jgi:nucleotide-binding universal stress UspA family protein